ncbi:MULTISPECIES: hypothetical protein [Pseudomonas]|uniref:Uncharacterized protein n=1 Tax=Pseudomonas fluorescens TaxID=294 RepID=A0A166QL64_PSEFL|nr:MULTISPECIES: hypothetical protein [Pseudomonas]KZN20460.1 hypothetical protein A1D17_02655 [Pseudomonas fluorescens]
MASSVVSGILQISKAAIVVALLCFIALTLATFIAINKSHNRTACLMSAQAVEECPVPSRWENLLRRVIGPDVKEIS